uniref:Uncharacterized protein n=1 Tax=Neovison vison TaxID=452646 RepID=A0A8C7AZU1_NEOVI
MPKKAGVINRGKNQSKEPGRPLPPLGPVVIDPTCCVAVAIHAKPGSKQNALTDVMAEAVRWSISWRSGGLHHCRRDLGEIKAAPPPQ